MFYNALYSANQLTSHKLGILKARLSFTNPRDNHKALTAAGIIRNI